MATFNDNPGGSLLKKIKSIIYGGKELNFKIVILGLRGVGKTALIIRCLADQFYNNYSQEEEKTYQHCVTYGQRKISFDIIETKGKNKALITNADAIFLVFSIIDLTSFHHMKDLLAKVQDLTFHKTPIMIIANKIDKVKQREVARQDYEEMEQMKGLRVFELSAAIPTLSLDIVFEEVYRQVYLSTKGSPSRSPSYSPLSRSPNRSPLFRRLKKQPYDKSISRSLGEGHFLSAIIHSPRPTMSSSSVLDLHEY